MGMLQTADYARHVFEAYADLHRSPRDIEEAVSVRVRRQELLYRGGKRFHVVLWEAALRARLCPPTVMAAQLDRLSGVIGLDTVILGIVPFEAALNLPPANGFWLYDERLVIAEDWHAEIWLDDPASVALYRRVWESLNRAAVHGPAAQRVIARCRQALDT
ncbi:DNA-binding protein [Kitasatospora cheerisanensis KCTC 2395]|uniref:DNA-binding protein n=1 Tax=Kitasatospora cheerisanensis KCTC 2395 TaxID=1348663 RepID=A0A066YX25_9ACTN|nr:DNA-binding protein [Kitasatospora cheerisanensis KCTC 2395]